MGKKSSSQMKAETGRHRQWQRNRPLKADDTRRRQKCHN